MGSDSFRFRLNRAGRWVYPRPAVVIIAGYTGRNQREAQDHIDELAAQGVPPPKSIPTFYETSAFLLSQRCVLETVSPATSGEVEFALVVDGEQVLVTVGSDHTNRTLERADVALAKQACPKPVADTAWLLEDLLPHWDSLRLQSWVDEDGGGFEPYQDGSVSQLLPPDQVLGLVPWKQKPRSFVLFGGTIPLIRKPSCRGRFRAELQDPVRSRTLRCEYLISSQGWLDT